jgi:hypothetical protein
MNVETPALRRAEGHDHRKRPADLADDRTAHVVRIGVSASGNGGVEIESERDGMDTTQRGNRTAREHKFHDFRRFGPASDAATGFPVR